MNEKSGSPNPNHALKRARESLGLSQGALAKKLGIPDKFLVSKWERGKHIPSLAHQRELCEFFQKSPEELEFRSPQGPPMLDSLVSQPSEEHGVENGASKRQSPQMRKFYEVVDETPETLGSSLEVREPMKEATPPRRRWSRVMIAGLSCLVVALLILGIGSRFVFAHTPIPPSCGGTSSDDFHGKLASGWNPIRFGSSMGGNTTYHLTKTSLDLSTTTNSSLDLNPALNFNAPRFLRSITGNFTIETCLEFRPDRSFQSAGILLWQDQAHFMRFERGFGGPAHNPQSGVFLQAWDQGSKIHDSGLENQLTTAGSIELRIQRQGDAIAASWREPGQAWRNVETFLFHFDSLMVGVDLVVDYDAPPITASYTYFRVSYP